MATTRGTRQSSTGIALESARRGPTPLTTGARADERLRAFGAWIRFGRELLKIAVIVVYFSFATYMCVADHNPVGFVPLLPWALGQRPTEEFLRRRRNRP